MRNHILLAALATWTAHPAFASTYGQLPYNMTGDYGVFAMSSAGPWTGNGISATSVTNFGVSATTGIRVLNTGTTPQSSTASIATSPNNTSESFSSARLGGASFWSDFVNGDALPAIIAVAYTDAGWFDTLLFSRPDLNGQAGHATARLHVSGILHGETPQGAARLSLALATNRTFPELLQTISGGADLEDGPYYEVVSQTYVVPIDFVWGTSFQMVVRGVTRIGVGSVFGGMPAGSTAGTDFGHSMFWDGFDSVSANGVELDTYALSAASGADYRQSFGPQADVPEPGTLALIGAGLVLAAISSRRIK